MRHGDTAISQNHPLRTLFQHLVRGNFRRGAQLDDPEVADYITGLGQRLMGVADSPRRDVTYFVLREETINAFALVGGHIGIHTGLFMLSQNESELAGVMAHEIAHAKRSHVARSIEKSTVPDLLAKILRRKGHDVRAVAEGEEALRLLGSEPFDLVLTDVVMPGMDGFDLLRRIKGLHPSVKVVVLTGYGSIATAVEAMRLGAVHYLTKPADADQIVHALQRGSADDAPAAPGEPLSLARLEWEHINQVLVSVSGNVSEAARQAGLDRSNFRRAARRAGIKTRDDG